MSYQNKRRSGLMFRPSAKSKQIKGFYLVGASTHLGASFPLSDLEIVLPCNGM